MNELKSLNGETEIPFTPLLSDFNKWYTIAEAKRQALQYLSSQIEIGKQQVKLRRALSLPKLSAGYASKRILGEKLQGIVIGISIPLWENRNTIKQTRAEVIPSASALEDNKTQFHNRLQSLFNKSAALRDTAQKYRDALSAYGNEPLLRKALDGGEISLLDYLPEAEFYDDAFNSMPEVEHNYALAVGGINSCGIIERIMRHLIILNSTIFAKNKINTTFETKYLFLLFYRLSNLNIE